MFSKSILFSFYWDENGKSQEGLFSFLIRILSLVISLWWKRAQDKQDNKATITLTTLHYAYSLKACLTYLICFKSLCS